MPYMEKLYSLELILVRMPCSGVATPGPTRAQALVEFVCTLIKLLTDSQA